MQSAIVRLTQRSSVRQRREANERVAGIPVKQESSACATPARFPTPRKSGIIGSDYGNSGVVEMHRRLPRSLEDLLDRHLRRRPRPIDEWQIMPRSGHFPALSKTGQVGV
jgi:hypothetical protein